MIVTCEQCQARYKLDDSKIKGRGAKITCPRCKHLFVVYNPAGHDNVLRMDIGAPAPPEPPQVAPVPTVASASSAPDKASRPKRTADDLNFKAVGISSWKVKVKIGLVYDFSDIKTLRKYIQDKRVTEDDVISYDGQEWVRIGDIPDLDTFFVRVWDEHDSRTQAANAASSKGPEIFEDGPTMIVGMGSLGANISTGIFNKPAVANPTSTETGSRSRETPSFGSSSQDSTGFADPFESLKARQREKASQRRDTSASPVAPPRPSSHRALAASAIFLGVVAVVLLGAWLLRPNTSTVVNSSTAAVPKPTAPDDAAYREEMRRKIQSELQEVSKGEPAPDDDDREPQAQFRPVGPGSTHPEATSGGHGSNGGSTVGTTGNGVTTAPATSGDHIAAGDSMYQQGDYRGAATAYGKALQIGPATPKLHYKLGEALFRAGSAAEAQQELNLAANGGVCSAHKLLGRLLNEQGDTPGAVGQYNEYLTCNPSDRASTEAEIKKLTGG
jgi:predicted Zn finger-like uncharacterized protein